MEHWAKADAHNGTLRIIITESNQITRMEIGRGSDCDFIMLDGAISRRHCVLEMAPFGAYVRDLGSKNGTYVNGYPIGCREDGCEGERMGYELRDGDELGLGNAFILKCSVSGGRPAGRTNGAARRCVECGRGYLPNRTESGGRCPACLEAARRRIRALRRELILVSCPQPVRKDGLATPETNAMPEVNGFREMDFLGSGGMGIVWSAKNMENNRVYALKTFQPNAEFSVTTDLLNRFLREALISSQLRHENIVRIHESGCTKNGVPYILMDYCNGGNVEKRMNKKPFSFEAATYIFLQILDGLEYLHNRAEAPAVVLSETGLEMKRVKGIAHRDLKPSNILLHWKPSNALSHSGDAPHTNEDAPRALIGDLGLAKTYLTAGNTPYTSNGAQLGSPQFVSKAQAADARDAGPAADIWAATAVYYYMLTGGKNPKNILIRSRDEKRIALAWNEAMERDALPIGDWLPGLYPKVRAVVDNVLKSVDNVRKDDNRFPSAAELRGQILTALPPEARDDRRIRAVADNAP